MSNSNYQICKIERIDRKIHGGLFGQDIKEWFLKYAAIVAGKNVVETKEYQFYPTPKGFDPNKSFGVHIDEIAYQELLQQLMNDRWEVVATDKKGRVTQMKKPMQAEQTAPSAAQTPSNIELLQQLASLKDAGILTEEEFQTKKAEILKRL
jgi:hypothetical protein